MLAALDVCYGAESAIAACVLFPAWNAEQPSDTKLALIKKVAAYEPGAFYRRELPCLMAVLDKVEEDLEAIVIDGYVWLSDEKHPGLGAYLYDSLGRRTIIVGAAKTAFKGAAFAEKSRARPSRPLYVTAAGAESKQAAQWIESMAGTHRLPTMLKLADTAARAEMARVSLAAVRKR